MCIYFATFKDDTLMSKVHKIALGNLTVKKNALSEFSKKGEREKKYVITYYLVVLLLAWLKNIS